jgi:hypothetical protein
MRTVSAIFAAVTFWASASASAASLCNCCGDGTASSCATACAAVKPSPGQCIAAFNPEGESTIGPDQNPLYEISLRDFRIETANRSELEAFRRLLEKARKAAETDRKSALRAAKTGKIDEVKAQSLAKRYDDGMVNYYLGIQAYRLARASADQ